MNKKISKTATGKGIFWIRLMLLCLLTASCKNEDPKVTASDATTSRLPADYMTASGIAEYNSAKLAANNIKAKQVKEIETSFIKKAGSTLALASDDATDLLSKSLGYYLGVVAEKSYADTLKIVGIIYTAHYSYFAIEARSKKDLTVYFKTISAAIFSGDLSKLFPERTKEIVTEILTKVVEVSKEMDDSPSAEELLVTVGEQAALSSEDEKSDILEGIADVLVDSAEELDEGEISTYFDNFVETISDGLVEVEDGETASDMIGAITESASNKVKKHKKNANKKLDSLITSTSNKLDKLVDKGRITEEQAGEVKEQVAGLKLESAPTSGPVSIAFSDSDPDAGQLSGELSIIVPSDESDITSYVIYFGSGATTKLSSSSVAKAYKAEGNLSYSIEANTSIPSGATHLLVFSANAVGESSSAAYVSIADAGPPSSAAASLSFSDGDSSSGEISGTLTINKAASESDITHYVLYWGTDATTKRASTAAITEIAVTGANVTYNFSANTSIPSGPAATHFLVFTKNANGEMSTPTALAISDGTTADVVLSDSFDRADGAYGTMDWQGHSDAGFTGLSSTEASATQSTSGTGTSVTIATNKLAVSYPNTNTYFARFTAASAIAGSNMYFYFVASGYSADCIPVFRFYSSNDTDYWAFTADDGNLQVKQNTILGAQVATGNFNSGTFWIQVEGSNLKIKGGTSTTVSYASFSGGFGSIVDLGGWANGSNCVISYDNFMVSRVKPSNWPSL